MKRQVLAAIASVALLWGCASSGANEVSAQTASGPALYVARDADSTMYLYGTIHLRKQGDPWGAPEVEAALAQADEIWTELEISPEVEARGQQLTMQYGLSRERPLSSWLSAEENQRLAATAQGLGLQAQALEPMRPWLAGLTLSIVPAMRAGYDPQAGVDRAVDAFGDANGKRMRAFETMEEQLGFFANLSDDLQRQMLLEAIDEAGRSVEVFDTMSAVWERGDLGVLETMMNDQMREEYPEVFEVLMTRRNNAWMTTLMQELEGSGVDFIAVGAGHLVGDVGLIEQLRARGVRVERVPTTPVP
jgi:hypothetical protein